MKKTLTWISNHWLRAFGYLAGIILLLSLMCFRLGSLLPNFSTPERTAVQNASLARLIADDPLYLPHKSLQWGVHKAGLHESVTAMRGVSAFYGVLCVVAFFILLKLWHTERVAVFGTALFASSSWFLHSARLATPEIIAALFSVLMLIFTYLCGYSLRRTHIVLGLLAASIVGALYVPGMIWIVFVILTWKRRAIGQALRKVKTRPLVIILAVSLLLLAPLIYAFVRDYHLVLTWLQLPAVVPTLHDYLNGLGASVATLFVQADPVPYLGLARLPLLDVFSGIMFVLGLYYWERQMSTKQVIMAILSVVCGLAVLALMHSRETFSMLLLPFVYLVVISGVIVLLQQWFTVFPRNPLARSIGIAAMTIVIGLVGLYHTTRYYIAWPNAPETKAAFSIHTSPPAP